MVTLQNIQDRPRQNHASAGGFRFGLGDYQFSLDSLHLPLHSQRSGPEVQVVPLQGQDLTPAQAGRQLQQKKLIASVFFGLDQQTLDFFSGQYRHFSGMGGWRFAVCGWVF